MPEVLAASCWPALADRLSGLAGEHGVPGWQLAVHDGFALQAVEAGVQAAGGGSAMTSAAPFPIGSITKCYTATLAMVLVADGDVALDRPVRDYLPELTDLGESLTLRRLLSHTGGLAADAPADTAQAATIRQHVRRHCQVRNLVLPPGSGFSYSNLGYVLAGHLIETLTGMSWWDAIASILLAPLGTEPAFVAAPRHHRPARPVVAGHSVNLVTGRTTPVEQSAAATQAPAGALAVSATDLVALGRMLVDPVEQALLPASLAAQMRRAVPGMDPCPLADGWGLGLAVFRDGGEEWVGHDGMADGMSCHLRIHPATGRVVAFAANANTGGRMWRDVVTELRGTGVAVPAARAARTRGRPGLPPPGCLGTYTLGTDLRYVVHTDRHGNLLMSVNGAPGEPAVLHDDLTYSLPDPASGEPVLTGRFVLSPATGAVHGLQIGGRFAGRRARSPGPADEA
jgi:CubicO group peptidase (beta-lactamase class C family)